MTALNNWSVIRYSGRADSLRDVKNIWDVLNFLNIEMMSAGGNHDSVKYVFHNAELVDFGGKEPMSFAWEFHNELRKAQTEILKVVQDKYRIESWPQ